MKKVVAGIDIGGTNTVFGLVERTGNIVAEERLKTTDYPEINNFVSALAAAINRMPDFIYIIYFTQLTLADFTSRELVPT